MLYQTLIEKTQSLLTYPREAEGGDVRPVAETMDVSSAAAWSPDGSVIVYTGPVVGIFGPLLMVRQDGTPLEPPPIQVKRTPNPS